MKTLWGELAWQLGAARGGTGAREAYAIVADADATRSNPGAALHRLIAAHAPCLILIDEWVAYARQLYGRDDLDGGTFDTQFTFAQTLTEVVKSVPRRDAGGVDPGVLGDAIGGGAGTRRVGPGGWRAERPGGPGPAAAGDPPDGRPVAARHLAGSRSRSCAAACSRSRMRPRGPTSARSPGHSPSSTPGTGASSPAAAAELAYEERIKAAYPIHPELFDRLYEDWSTLERFQRTRGVLRLMSAVIYALWQAGDAAPLIMPGGVPLDSERVRSELTQYLEDDFKPIIDADIDGEGSTPAGSTGTGRCSGSVQSPGGSPGPSSSARRPRSIRAQGHRAALDLAGRGGARRHGRQLRVGAAPAVRPRHLPLQ